MTKNRSIHGLVALLALAAPSIAQADAAPLTPPAVLGAARTIQFTATDVLGHAGTPVRTSVAFLAQPNKAFVQDTDAKTKAVETVYASDGKTLTVYDQSLNRYKSPLPPQV